MVFVIERVSGTNRLELRVVLEPGEEPYKALIEYRMMLRKMEKDLPNRIDGVMVIRSEELE